MGDWHIGEPPSLGEPKDPEDPGRSLASSQFGLAFSVPSDAIHLSSLGLRSKHGPGSRSLEDAIRERRTKQGKGPSN